MQAACPYHLVFRANNVKGGSSCTLVRHLEDRNEDNLQYAECLRREQEFQAEGGALMVFSVDNPVTNASRLLPDVCVRNICCGSQHSLILDNSGYVWAWGSSQKGQTGSGDFEFVYKPSRIACNSSRNMNFKSIAAGSSHSVAVAVSGEVWVFGDNSVGQLGIGTIHEKKAILENKFNMQNQLKKLKNHFIELQDEIKTVKKEENNQSIAERNSNMIKFTWCTVVAQWNRQIN